MGLGSKINDLTIAKEILSCKGVSKFTLSNLNRIDAEIYTSLSHTILGAKHPVYTTYSNDMEKCSVTIKPNNSNGAYK
jgi:hypothetical protein